MGLRRCLTVRSRVIAVVDQRDEKAQQLPAPGQLEITVDSSGVIWLHQMSGTATPPTTVRLSHRPSPTAGGSVVPVVGVTAVELTAPALVRCPRLCCSVTDPCRVDQFHRPFHWVPAITITEPSAASADRGVPPTSMAYLPAVGAPGYTDTVPSPELLA